MEQLGEVFIDIHHLIVQKKDRGSSAFHKELEHFMFHQF